MVDENRVVDKNVDIVKKEYLSDPNFTPAVLENKSKAAKGLCSWVISIVSYYDVIQGIEPKRKALAAAEIQYAEA